MYRQDNNKSGGLLRDNLVHDYKLDLADELSHELIELRTRDQEYTCLKDQVFDLQRKLNRLSCENSSMKVNNDNIMDSSDAMIIELSQDLNDQRNQLQ